MRINWKREVIWGIRLGELAAFMGVYFFLYALYCLTLTINESAYVNISFDKLLQNYLISQSIDYGLKFLYTIPLWYLYFKVLKHWSLYHKIVLHQFTSFLFVLCWIKSFYFILEILGRGHLRGTSQIWDIYIPALIYIIQFGIFHAYEYHLEVQRQREREAQLRQATLQSELTAIKAQLNPHFLYNVFNTISASVPPEMEHTREMIAVLADMFRYQLRASVEDTVALGDELAFVEQYLSLEKDRFGSRLQTVLNVEPAILQEKIPPMLLQPLVENAVKHGISPKIEGGTVQLNIDKRGQALHVELSDTGVGLSDYQAVLGKGIGLTNTQLRLEKMFGTQLHMRPNTPSGLIISFDIPTH
jgi:two-component system, LytTR family, sensor kinase